MSLIGYAVLNAKTPKKATRIFYMGNEFEEALEVYNDDTTARYLVQINFTHFAINPCTQCPVCKSSLK